MFSVVFSNNTDGVFHLKVCGVRACTSIVVWGTPIEYMIAKHFVDKLNEHRIPEEKLFDAIHEFLAELHKLNQIDS